MDHYVDLDKLSERQRLVLEKASEAMKLAHAPCSGFHVGAALISPDGRIFAGSNVENASYGATICAERSAIVIANSLGCRTFEYLAIIARGKGFITKEVTAPCGICRQVLFEFAQLAGLNIAIILATTNKDKILVTTIEDLLPRGFGPKDLGIDLTPFRR